MTRQTVFDGIRADLSRNMFTERKLLTNEATVEKFFLDKLIKDLGYKDRNILPQAVIARENVPMGSRSTPYRPDYVIKVNRKPRIIIDAKSPKEDVFQHLQQCIGYCMLQNRKHDTNPVKYFMLSNGLDTVIYEWDKQDPILELKFENFHRDDQGYLKLRDLISSEGILDQDAVKKIHSTVKLQKITKEKAQQVFARCHRKIWKSDKISPESAFIQFVKIIFVKLYHDRNLHDLYHDQKDGQSLVIPEQANTFSESWIKRMYQHNSNPISELTYYGLLKKIEEDIRRNKKKRMFDLDDKIDLKPNTMLAVVKMLEKYDLYGIDDDLNGRLFETFLNATMRGSDLGQYFTPRSIVKLGVALADIEVSERHVDVVLDGCCGTGGFLIEAFAKMKEIVAANNSYSKETKKMLLDKITNSIYGMDVAKSPMLARIARINMYLHGDGGSHIYYADGLDKDLMTDPTESDEVKNNMDDLKSNISRVQGFDVILTNPPFSMSYGQEDESERRVLKQYELACYAGGGGG